MFRKQDFKKVDLLGNGKKNTKIYKVLHIASGRYYALKEVEAKSLDKLNEYKVSFPGETSLLTIHNVSVISNYRRKLCSFSKLAPTICASSSGRDDMKAPTVSPSWSARLFAGCAMAKAPF